MDRWMEWNGSSSPTWPQVLATCPNANNLQDSPYSETFGLSVTLEGWACNELTNSNGFLILGFKVDFYMHFYMMWANRVFYFDLTFNNSSTSAFHAKLTILTKFWSLWQEKMSYKCKLWMHITQSLSKPRNFVK